MTVQPGVLVHLCGREEWSRVRDRGGIQPGHPPGFIHLSTPEQVHLPANRLYRGRDDLVLLHIDPALLDAPVRWEAGVATDPESMLFPHLYGPLPVRAVTGVTAYPPAPDGTFPPVAT
ncbi:glutathione S-transferase [Mycobacterium sp. 1554424.7]|nr:glutathione S-transferase [Mycobacterium sp. 1554424.7]